MNLHGDTHSTTYFSILENDDANFFDLENHGNRLVEKQRFLESQLQETHTQIKALTFSKMELEMTLNRERRELTNMKAQLEVIQGTMQCWEQERSSEKDTFVTHKLQLESLQKERNLCNEQLKNLEVQNIELKLDVDNLEKRIRNQNQEKNLLNLKKKTTDTLIEKVYGEIQKLEKDLTSLKKRIVLAKYSGEQMIVLLEQHHDALNNIYEENENLTRSKIILEGELKHLNKGQRTAQINNLNSNNNELQRLHQQIQDVNELIEQEEKINDLNQKLMMEIEEKNKLNQTLKIFIKEQINTTLKFV